MRRIFCLGLALLALGWETLVSQADEKKTLGWQNGGYFSLQNQEGRWVFVDPNGQPFYSIGMVYAYGPELGPAKPQLTPEKVIEELEKMKGHGFNTLDLYGKFFLDDILAWCDRNGMAVYLRTSYSEVKGLSPERSEFPDFMDPAFRDAAKNFMAAIVSDVKDYHSILAIDMDQRWLFGVDWAGARRVGEPRLGPEAVRFFSQWLQTRYGQVTRLNEVWGKSYQQFSEAIQDPEIFLNGQVQDSSRKPWRLDLVEYALWTINDFLKDLTAAMRAVDPNHLITYTSELPEVIPFPISTKENSGLDFISPVHYNHHSDFGRDWISNAKLIFQTKFQSDLSGLPTYVNETGFRTVPLHQRPPNLAYAMSQDDEQKAQLYLEQISLMNIYPWLTGWSYFKWYDKWPEGDFGYIQNDGSLKPISKLGKLVNPKLQINWQSEGEPRAIVFYPSYALAAPLTGSQQYKSLGFMLEESFLKAHQKMLRDCLVVLRGVESAEGLSPALFSDLTSTFKQEWVPFKFSAQVRSDLPVLLAGRSLEMLSDEDRSRLMKSKTISFGQIGLYNERFKVTTPWHLEVLGIPPKAYEEKMLPQALDHSAQGEPQLVSCSKDAAKFMLPERKGKDLKFVSCEGQTLEIQKGVYTNVDFLMASHSGDMTAKIIFHYSDDTEESQYLAPTVGDFRFKPTFNHCGWQGIVSGDREGYLSHIRISCNASKELVSITLPKESNLCVYAFSLVEGGDSYGIKVSLQWGDFKSQGTTPWLLALREGIGDYETLATFENGRPAIVQSRDGRHIAFLYDPLTWQGNEGEISQDVNFHAALLKDLLKRLK